MLAMLLRVPLTAPQICGVALCLRGICLCDAQVARASGERSDEEKKQLQGRIAELSVELEAAASTEKMLLSQTKRLKDELKRVQRKQADMEVQLEGLASRATEIELSNKSSEEALRVASREKEVCSQSFPLLLCWSDPRNVVCLLAHIPIALALY